MKIKAFTFCVVILIVVPMLLFSKNTPIVDSIPASYVTGLYNPKIPMYKYYAIDTVGVEELPNREKKVDVVRRPYTENEIIKRYSKEIYLRDTIMIFDYQTYAQSTEVKETRMIEAYFLLMQRELGNDRPDANKIRKWSKKAKIKRKHYNI